MLNIAEARKLLDQLEALGVDSIRVAMPFFERKVPDELSKDFFVVLEDSAWGTEIVVPQSRLAKDSPPA